MAVVVSVSVPDDLNSKWKQSDLKIKEYEIILEKAKKEVLKIHFESKSILEKDIKSKKDVIEKEIEKEILEDQIFLKKLNGRKPKRVIIVTGKIINFVV